MIILRTVKNFSALNVVASILLFLTAILAAVVANSSLAPVYQSFLSQELHLRIGDFNLLSHGGHNLTMIEFINDCLMTIFFKREEINQWLESNCIETLEESFKKREKKEINFKPRKND